MCGWLLAESAANGKSTIYSNAVQWLQLVATFEIILVVIIRLQFALKN